MLLVEQNAAQDDRLLRPLCRAQSAAWSRLGEQRGIGARSRCPPGLPGQHLKSNSDAGVHTMTEDGKIGPRPASRSVWHYDAAGSRSRGSRTSRRAPASGPARRTSRRLPHRERRAGRSRRPLCTPRCFVVDGQSRRRERAVSVSRLGVGGRNGACLASPRWPTSVKSHPGPAFPPFRHASIGGWSGRCSGSRSASSQPSLVRPDEWIWGHGPPFELPVAFGVMIENFRDLSHLAFVHQRTLGVVPEVIEPLEVERDGGEVRMSRKMQIGAGEEIWRSVRELRYHVIAPNFTSVHMFTDRVSAVCCTPPARSAPPSPRTTGSRA